MCSRTLSVSGTFDTCSIAPTRIRASIRPGSIPKSRADPASGRISPINNRTVVVLPAPFGPSSATTSPARISKSSSETAFTLPKLLLAHSSAATTPWPAPACSRPSSLILPSPPVALMRIGSSRGFTPLMLEPVSQPRHTGIRVRRHQFGLTDVIHERRELLRRGPACPVLPVALSELKRVAQLTSVYRIAPRIPPTPFPPLRGGRGHHAHLHRSGSDLADGQLLRVRRLPEIALEARIDLGIVKRAAETDDRQELTLRETAHVDPGGGIDEDPDRTRAVVDEHLLAEGRVGHDGLGDHAHHPDDPPLVGGADAAGAHPERFHAPPMTPHLHIAIARRHQGQQAEAVDELAGDQHTLPDGEPEVRGDADVDAAGVVLDGEALVEAAGREITGRDGDRSLDRDHGPQRQQARGADVDRMRFVGRGHRRHRGERETEDDEACGAQG